MRSPHAHPFLQPHHSHDLLHITAITTPLPNQRTTLVSPPYLQVVMRVYVHEFCGLPKSESIQKNCSHSEGCEGSLKDPGDADKLDASLRSLCGAASRCMSCETLASGCRKRRRYGCGEPPFDMTTSLKALCSVSMRSLAPMLVIKGGDCAVQRAICSIRVGRHECAC